MSLAARPAAHRLRRRDPGGVANPDDPPVVRRPLIRLCAVTDVSAGRATLTRLSQTLSVILLRLQDGTLTAYRNACPHMGIELDWDPARLLTKDARHLKCTGHHALFDVQTGTCVKGPCQGEILTRLKIQESNGEVFLDPAAPP
jgi:nitrite reductase/ring-hydroxylating ferredoxin subunit